MKMDRSLATLLGSWQTSDRPDDAFRLLPNATYILSRLSNPLNVTLLASHVLSNDLLYPEPADVDRCKQVFGAFYTATLRFQEDKETPSRALAYAQQIQQSQSNLPTTEWVRAVVKGADEQSPRWRHTLLLGGLLLALQSKDFDSVPHDYRNKLETALVTASNLALLQEKSHPGCQVVVSFVLNHTFSILSEHHRSLLNYDLLLPVLVDSSFFSRDGLEHGYWLATIDQDVHPTSEQKFRWSSTSTSFRKVTELKARPLVAGLGAMSRLLAHCVDHVQDHTLVLYATIRLSEFSRNLMTSWRQNKMSEVDQREEAEFLDQETYSQTLPFLLRMLRDSMFATVIALRSVLGRLLCDSILASDDHAPMLAMQALHTLRDTYFIAHRFGLVSSSQYIFVNFTAIDVLSRYPVQSQNFLESIRPTQNGPVPSHPLDRTLDLFFLNTSEHFTLVLPPLINQDLLYNAATLYINPQGDPRLGELYEAAHSLMLAIFAAPQNGQVAVSNIPSYIDTLMKSFPQPLTPRQFRLAIKSIVRLAAPPSPIAASMPCMQAAVLILLKERLDFASEAPLPPEPDNPVEGSGDLSEKSVLLLSVIDCLSYLPIPLLEEWLFVTAEMLHRIADPGQSKQCQSRLWETISNGEMDVDRAACCVAWWTSRGGREHVLLGQQPEMDDFHMSGALPAESRL